MARLVADADVYTAFADADGQPLWLGRSKRSASLAQRIMLAARDGGCIGCNSPPERCEAHHIQHWTDGGPTDVDNLALLCPGCHHLVHDCNWQVCREPLSLHRIKAPPDPFPEHGTTTYRLVQHSPVLRN
ncbi:HNH endonuclease [Candidatus Poriferisocius sp.]|uniref:HNH endonuclease signature motif containing protein n=1 Tax=Candidatus Poriferisocius sp. TaxID=3101276 RepID=UPI003B014530